MHIYPQPRYLKPAASGAWLHRSVSNATVGVRSPQASDPRIRQKLVTLAVDERLNITFGPTASEPLIRIDEDNGLDEDAYRLVI